MKKFTIFTLVAVIGFILAFVGVYINDKVENGDTQTIPTINLPFNSFIAATGIVESSSKNIAIGSLVSGVIKEIFIKNAQTVHKGQLLFTLDDSDMQTQIALLQAKKEVLLAQLQATKDQLKLVKEFSKLSNGMVTAEKFKAKEDAYKLAKASLQSLEKQIKILQAKKEQYKIYAPIDGVVLHSQLTVGSYFDKNNPKNSLILGSNTHNLNVSINEYDIARLQKDMPAIAYVRGRPELRVKLQYLYTIPFVTPKRDLTGSSTEKTDTRVLHVVYAIDKKAPFALFVGEQLDVFIKTDK